MQYTIDELKYKLEQQNRDSDENLITELRDRIRNLEYQLSEANSRNRELSRLVDSARDNDRSWYNRMTDNPFADLRYTNLE